MHAHFREMLWYLSRGDWRSRFDSESDSGLQEQAPLREAHNNILASRVDIDVGPSVNTVGGNSEDNSDGGRRDLQDREATASHEQPDRADRPRIQRMTKRPR